MTLRQIPFSNYNHLINILNSLAIPASVTNATVSLIVTPRNTATYLSLTVLIHTSPRTYTAQQLSDMFTTGGQQLDLAHYFGDTDVGGIIFVPVEYLPSA